MKSNSAIALALALTVSRAGAQVTISAAQCDSIVANAIADPARSDTLRLVAFCPGRYGTTFASLLASYNLVSDSATYLQIFGYASTRREPEIFAAASTIATDGGAPILARLAALSVLTRYERGWFPIDLIAIEAGGAGNGCLPISTVDGVTDGENLLPNGHEAAAHAVAISVLASSPAVSVRLLADCLNFGTTHVPKGASFAVTPDPAFNFRTNISYVAQCGRRVLIRNSSYSYVVTTLSWGPGTSNSRKWTIPSRKGGSAYSETVWVVPGTSATASLVGPTALTSLVMSVNSTSC